MAGVHTRLPCTRDNGPQRKHFTGQRLQDLLAAERFRLVEV